MNHRLILFVWALALSLVTSLVHAVTCSANMSLASNPDSAYTDNGDGTVTHTPTGLNWKRCTEGQTWSGGICSGSASSHTWAQALTQAANSSFAGQTDWRLPDIKELRSLAEECRINPAINDAIFPNTLGSNFWSGSPYANDSSDAWYVNFSSGYASNDIRNNSYAVRLVRGGQSFGSFVLAVSKSGTGTGTVTGSAAGINCGSTCSASLASGASVTLTATPASGSTFSGWSGACSGTGSCTVSMNAVKSVIATFTLNVTAPICTLSANPSSFTVGGSSTLTASCTPAATSYIWTGGTCAGTTAATCTVTPTSTTTYSVTGTNAGGTGAAASATVTVNACTYALGSSSESVAASASTGSISVTSSCAWTATSNASWITITSGASGSGNGTVAYAVATNTSTSARSGTLSIAGQTFTVAQAGATVAAPVCTLGASSSSITVGGSSTLTASCTSAATSYIWTGGTCAGTTAATCTVSPTTTTTYTVKGTNTGGTGAAASVTVSTISTYTLSVTKSGAGSGTVTSSPSGISCGPTCSTSLTSGTSVTLTATPATGSTFTGWSGACSGTGSCTVSVTTDKSVTASFGVARYTDNADGTVTDPNTGLTWMRCAMGQVWNGSTCLGTAATYTFDQANALTGTTTFANQSDWRMPNIRELQTIVDRSVYNPAIDSAAFPNTPGSLFWSGSPYASYSSGAWNVYFYYGDAYGSIQSSGGAVRLVRGGQSFGSLLGITRPTSDYVDNGNGTVTHTSTNLTWKRCPELQTWTGSTCSGTATTFTFDQATALADTTTFAGQSDWRLPTEDELLSLVDYSAYVPSINTSIFPTTPGSYFWSSSPYAYSSNYAWNVNFDYGSADGYGNRGSYFAVRLVRGGQPFGSFVLAVSKSGTGTGTVTGAATGINCGNICSASLASGTSVTLTATPASGSTFSGWSGACSGTGSCTVGMNAVKSVTATFTLSVTAPVCTLSADPSSFTAGGSSTLTASCTPAATSYTWTGGACTGTTAATCTVTPTATTTYTVAGVNAGGAGVAASATVTVNACTYGLGTSSASVAASANTGSISVTSSCAWTATSNASWISITSGASDSGNGSVSYTVAANTGTTARTGSLTIAGQTFTVTQAGATVSVPICTLSANPASITAGSSSTLTASCSPTATSYTWTGGTCAGTTAATCTVIPTATTTYTVAGVDAGGAGAAASATVTVTSSSTLQPNADGTVTDPKTGLTWMRCSMGQAWNGSTCPGTAATYTFDQANALTGTTTFAGQSDWRMPNIRELQTIVDRSVYGPAIDSVAFPNTPSSFFWSGSPYANDSSYAWFVYFNSGGALNGYRGSSNAVRLVRGGQPFAPLLGIGITRPTSDYVDHGNGTVTHTPTNLTWKRCPELQTWTGSTCSGTATNFTFDQATVLADTTTFAGQSDWRLPTEDELLSLVDYSTYGPAINSSIFPATPGSYFWSGSPRADDSSYAWRVSFGNGYADYYYRSSSYAVWLVRGGQSFGSLDSTAPSVPNGLAASVASSSQINLSWIAATDNVGVTAYKVYRNSVLIATLGNVTNYSNTGLSASTSYSYTVAACDAAGNCSSQSVAASAITAGVAPAFTLPVHVSTITYGFDQPGPFYNLDTYVTINNEPTTSISSFGFYSMYQFQFQNGVIGYMGLQKDDWQGKKAIFSIWDGANVVSANPVASNCVRFGHEGSGTMCLQPFQWVVGREYRIRIMTLGVTGNDETWEAFVQDTVTGPETLIGSIKLSSNAGFNGYGRLTNSSFGVEEYYGGASYTCNTLPYFSFTRRGPYADNNSYSASSANIVFPTYGNAFPYFPCTNSNVTTTGRPYITQEAGGSIVRTASPTNAWNISAPVLTATAASSSQINLAWTGSSAINAYKVYRAGALIATLGNVTSYSDTGLNASTSYSYTVQACDTAGNCSAQSAAASATTTMVVDITSPSTPSGLVTAAVGSSQINLSWNAATDNVGVTAYKVYRNGTLIAALGNVTNYSNTSLSASTSYSYTVQACDAAGNCSAQTNPVSASTAAALTPPVCTLIANPSSITSGGSSTLTATCSPAATSYVWTGGTCAGATGSTCTVTPTATTTYSVQGSNAGGTNQAAGATVTVTANTASYTVPGTLGNDVFVLTAGNNYYGGAGNDTYIISPSTLRGVVTAKIIDTEGDNLIQLVDGMTVTASNFYADAAQLTLSSGATVQILGASKFKYQVGANVLAGDTAAVLTYSEFVSSLGASLSGTLPASGTAGYVVPTGFTQASAPVPSVAGSSYTVPGTLGGDVLAPSGGNNYLGGGGNDVYIISPYTLSGLVTAKIIDSEGSNVIQLVSGLTIASSTFYNNAVQLTLSSGASVQILGASGFSYQLGANAPAGVVATSLSYAQFAAALGASVPAGASAVSGSANFVVN